MTAMTLSHVGSDTDALSSAHATVPIPKRLRVNGVAQVGTRFFVVQIGRGGSDGGVNDPDKGRARMGQSAVIAIE